MRRCRQIIWKKYLKITSTSSQMRMALPELKGKGKNVWRKKEKKEGEEKITAYETVC